MNVETYVKAHYSHSKSGKKEKVSGHPMKLNAAIHRRHQKRLKLEEKILERGGPNYYAMGEDLQSTKNHPGYSEDVSARANVERGRRYRGGQLYKKVAAQLQQLANITHSEMYKEAADLARARAHYDGEYKSDRMRLRA